MNRVFHIEHLNGDHWTFGEFSAYMNRVHPEAGGFFDAFMSQYGDLALLGEDGKLYYTDPGRDLKPFHGHDMVVVWDD